MDNATRSRKRPVLAAIILAGLAVALAFAIDRLRRHNSTPDRDRLAEARSHFRQKDFAAAEAAAKTVLEDDPHCAAALVIAAESATKLGRLEDALRYYARIPKDAGKETVTGLFGSGEILVHLCRLSEGETRLRAALQRDPQHRQANYRLAFVLGVTGRSWEAGPHVLKLIQNRMFPVSHLLLTGDAERTVKSGGHLEKCRQAAPNDPLPLLGLARVESDANHHQAAITLLKRVVAQRPREWEAQARLGLAFLARREIAELSKWHAALPREADSHPEIWIVRGLRQRELKHPRAAIRCFGEALRLAPNHRRANYQLGQLLQIIGHPGLADRFLKRASTLQQLSTAIDRVHRHWARRQFDFEGLRQVVGTMESLGRYWEAWAWTQIALQQRPGLPWAVASLKRTQPRLIKDLPLTDPAKSPAGGLNLAAYPLPDRLQAARQKSTKRGGTASGIRFRDSAATAGIAFRYFNSADADTPGARIFETTGGGVAAIDFDGDGWPDLYFTQGADRSDANSKAIYRDRFYRNLGNGRFNDVTAAAGLGDRDFSQGPAVGDFDGDGFPDLYVANLGQNRLYRNNGDGTFSDVTQAAGLHAREWTTSCLVADLNGDGLSDLYDVNYTVLDNPSRICERDGKPMACSPLAFKPAQDRVFLNRGDGRFDEATATAGIRTANGYGLGIVAADVHGSGRLDLFVANDQTENFFFVNRSADGKTMFAEDALARGLALDAEGKAQGCMGVAAGDANSDGRLDLFVSNFFNESNTLYIGQAAGFFSDETRRARLRNPGFALLGFGTQFLDAELDGHPDLVVANGHIDDLSQLGEPYKMPTTFFHNLGGTQFATMQPGALGPYFERKVLGRGLARVDWNRDGKDDFVVSHIGDAAALMTNATRTSHHFIAVRLRATTGCRDAIGTTVTVRRGTWQRTRQLTAGDGYMASNQRQLIFGLGVHDRIDELRIRWPGRPEQVIQNLAADAEWMVIEGRQRPLALPRPDSGTTKDW